MEDNVTRQKRLNQISNPQRGPHGAGRDMANVDFWSARASENSRIAPRASDGPPKLPSTKVNVRDTSMRPYASRKSGDVIEQAKASLNNSGDSPYLRGIRRTT
jgi:hypothetical protein